MHPQYSNNMIIKILKRLENISDTLDNQSNLISLS
jgi:hypothetical protein